MRRGKQWEACLVLLIAAAPVRAESRIVVDCTAAAEKQMADVVDVPGRPGAKGLSLKAEVGQFGWYTLPLGRTLPAGQYQAEYSVSATQPAAASVALYAASGGNHVQIGPPRTAAAGTAATYRDFFHSPAPFSAVAVKKMSGDRTPSAAVGQVVLTDLGRREHPRLEAYRALMRFPAPWGLRSPAVERLLESPDRLPEVEGWLDLRSDIAELFCRWDYLSRVARLMGGAEAAAQVQAVEGGMLDLRRAVVENRQAEMASGVAEGTRWVDELQRQVEGRLGGTVCPELGTDIFTWLKAWTFLGVGGDGEHSEPSPHRAVYDGFSLTLTDRPEPARMDSTWTSSTYADERMTSRYSMLIPLTVVDVVGGRFELAIRGGALEHVVLPNGGSAAIKTGTVPGVDEMLSEGWFALWSSRGGVLFVVNRRPKAAQWTGDRLIVEFAGPAAVGYLTLPGRMRDRLAEAARSYGRVLVKQPVECVQVQRGRGIEQVFEYAERPCDWLVKPVTISPVPHLLMLSLEPSSKLKVTMSQPIVRSPDGWAYVNDTNRLKYELPERPLADTRGTNIIVANKQNSLSFYRELAQQGCRTIRLVGGSSLTPTPAEAEKERQCLRQNLEWIRQAGSLRAGIDMLHAGASTETYTDPNGLRRFVNRWKDIISWCDGYSDVVAWYDLVNEPDPNPHAYHAFMREVVRALRPVAGKTAILVEVAHGGNPNGLNSWEDAGDGNIIVGYHDYWPHMFTHQLCVEQGSASAPRVFYPSWMPWIQWSPPSWRNDDPAWHYWDRWKCEAINVGAFRLIITAGLRLDCGEYGVVGYAGEASRRSAVLWLRHACQRFDRLGINHDVWSVSDDTGFTWLLPECRAEMLGYWKQKTGRTRGQGVR